MSNIGNKIVNLILWVLTLYCIISVVMIEGVVYKVVTFITLVAICPLVNKRLVKGLKGKTAVIVRSSICVIAIMVNLLMVAIAPVSLSESRAIYVAADVLKEKYKEYQTIDVKSATMSLGEEKNNVQTVYISFTSNAMKNNISSVRHDKITIYFNEKTYQYSTELGGAK